METLGSLEEVVLLLVLKNTRINGAEVAREYIAHSKKPISLPAIITVLKRLEAKGLLFSEYGPPTAERGGKRKKFYQATSKGYHLVLEVQLSRTQLWETIPKMS